MSNFSLFAIYDHPKDYPNHFVVREHVIYPGQILPGIAQFANSLEEARSLIPPGMVCVERHPDDDPVVVETWI